MALPALDHLDRVLFEWPEPLVIDTIGACYGDACDGDASGYDASDDDEPDDGEHRVAARLHARFLRALIDGDARRSAPLRAQLVACCAACNIGSGAIDAADHAVFRELTDIVQSRFRHSQRLRQHFLRQLHEALGALTVRREPAKPVAAKRVPSRPASRFGRALAFSG